MRYCLILFLFLASCQSNTQGTKDPVTGTWVYERIELYSGEPFDLSDSMYNALHRQHIGLQLDFSGGKTFAVVQKRPGKPDESLGRQDYKMEGDTILRLINRGRPDDRFPVVSLSDSLFKLNLFHSDFGYLVFRRKGS